MESPSSTSVRMDPVNLLRIMPVLYSVFRDYGEPSSFSSTGGGGDRPTAV